VGDAEHGDHQAPLDGGRARQVVAGVAGEGGQDRQGQERVDRDEDGVQAVPLDPHEVVLEREDHEEADHQRPVIAVSGRRDRRVLPQCHERGEREQRDDAALAGQEGESDRRRHHPPRLDAGIEVVDDGVGRAPGDPHLEREAHH